MKQVYYFTSPTCGPCRMLGPLMEELKSKMDIQKYSIDQPDGRDMAMQYNVRAVPTVIYVLDGQEIDRVTGANHAGIYLDKWQSY